MRQGEFTLTPPPVVYPDAPGFKEPTTSKDAAEKVDAGRLRKLVLAALQQHGPMTPDECADRLKLSILSIRPRFTELGKHLKVIVDTGERRPNRSGHLAKVWAVTSGR